MARRPRQPRRRRPASKAAKTPQASSENTVLWSQRQPCRPVAAVTAAVGVHGWRWDHKTVFSLLAWGVFAALLVGRRQRGWRGRRATRWLYAGAALLLLGYAGSRFVLEVLLGRAVT